jgi:hypothetical protein
MKKINKVLALLMLLIAGSSAMHAEFRWGPTAGVGINSFKFKQDLITTGNLVGPQAGVAGEVMFPGIGFGIDISAFYSMEGGEMNLGEKKIWAVDGYGKEKSYLHTLSIPIDLRFKWTRMDGFEDYLAPYVFGGPVFDFHVAHNNLKAMDTTFGALGLQVGAGVELLKHWQVQASYNWGMTYSVKAVKLLDFSARCNYWSVRAAYLF